MEEEIKSLSDKGILIRKGDKISFEKGTAIFREKNVKESIKQLKEKILGIADPKIQEEIINEVFGKDLI